MIFLETAELRAKNRLDIIMDFWRNNVDKILELNDKKVLTGKGSVSNALMEKTIAEIYDTFDNRRKSFEALKADEIDLAELKELENKIEKQNE